MGRGRAPCCDKDKVKRGPWSPAEDLRLITFIQKHGHDNWRALPKQAGLLRCGKSCRLRWINYLRPDVKRGNFTKEEEETIIRLHETLGNKWSKIASHLAGRTDNEIKNVWNTHLKKRLGNIPQKSSSFAVALTDEEQDFKTELLNHSSSCSISNTNSSHVYASNQAEANNTSEEVNKPEIFDIPLESDFDFWNMLDSLGSHQVENQKWLLSELGLEVTKNENQTNFSNEMGMGHYHI
ncbi:hypothetical protein PTKIN_Ptkin19aG0006100 [Pterospermum kingtungense]